MVAISYSREMVEKSMENPFGCVALSRRSGQLLGSLLKVPQRVK